MFANADSPLRIYSFLVQLPISPLATPIFPTKVEALQSSMRQCSSYSGHSHLEWLNRVILPKHFNTGKGRPSSLGKKKQNTIFSSSIWLFLENFESASIWFALERLQKSGGLQFDHCTILDLHLWAGINRTKKWKFSKKIFTNNLRFAKFANIFFRELFPLYSRLLLIMYVLYSAVQCAEDCFLYGCTYHLFSLQVFGCL